MREGKQMSKQTLVISQIRLSNPMSDIQSRLEVLPMGEVIEEGGKKYIKVAQDSCEVEYSSDWQAYKFDGNSIGSYQIEKPVTANEIESVIVGAFEGGSNYWLGVDNSTAIWENKPKGIPLSTWATQMLLEGETLDFYDKEDKEEKWTLTLSQLVNGFKLNYELRTWDRDILDGDAYTADAILQYGIFGKQVYG